jgi:hypothetical protein
MSYNPAGVSQELHDMVPAPASAATPRTIFKTEDGILFAYGLTAVNAAPLTTSGLWAPGCIYLKVLTAGSSVMYFNIGTLASPSWQDQK